MRTYYNNNKMNSQQAKQVIERKAVFQNACKDVINRNKYIMGKHKSNKEADEQNSYELTQELKKYSKEQLHPEDREGANLCYVKTGLRIEHCDHQIKKCKLTIILISHAHNLNIEKAEEYLNKYKEHSHLAMENMAVMMERDPDFKCNFADKNLHTKGEMSYKTACDDMMEEIKTLEKFLSYVKAFVTANEVIKAKNNMIKRKRKNKNK